MSHSGEAEVDAVGLDADTYVVSARQSGQKRDSSQRRCALETNTCPNGGEGACRRVVEHGGRENSSRTATVECRLTSEAALSSALPALVDISHRGSLVRSRAANMRWRVGAKSDFEAKSKRSAKSRATRAA